jgi:dTDP-4-dehydrorhamnose 3,5-epimerase
VELTEDNHRQLWVPPGFAHGFYVISDRADFLYKTTNYYFPEHERSLLWNDPVIGISWSLEGDREPVVSDKDKNAAKLAQAEVFS